MLNDVNISLGSDRGGINIGETLARAQRPCASRDRAALGAI